MMALSPIAAIMVWLRFGVGLLAAVVVVVVVMVSDAHFMDAHFMDAHFMDAHFMDAHFMDALNHASILFERCVEIVKKV